jgi:hypothetical protein
MSQDLAAFNVSCERCFERMGKGVQYTPVVVEGRPVVQCPICGAREGQTLLRAPQEKIE